MQMLDLQKEKNTLPKAYLVGTCEVPAPMSDAREHLDELRELVTTLGVDVSGSMIVTIRQFNPRYYIGSGKALEIKEAAEQLDCEVIIFDSTLGPSQQRNLERLCGKKVIDRQEVILDIFASRARTREAVLQVDLARCQYFLPRLTGAWTHLSRQRGGGTGARGDGEKQIEYDRRQLKKRIGELESELTVVRKQREVQRKERVRNQIPQCAIVGYTNAGKSSLLNSLTGADVLAADKLFATLDPTTRHLRLPGNQELLLTDTVGFVRKLPHALVEAFKSTLEEAVLADFLLLVLDASSPHVQTHWETTLSVLAELGAEQKTMISVFNKCDLLQDDPVNLIKLKSIAPSAVFVSCTTGMGLDDLKARLVSLAGKDTEIRQLAIPPSRQDLIALLHSKCTILDSKYEDDGTFSVTAKIPASQSAVFAVYYLDKNKIGSITDVAAL